MDNKEIYYKQSDVWGKSIEHYQFQVLTDILDMIPQDIESILDVGCGDGHITNHLPEDIRVVGLDISESALQYVTREKFVGNILNLPFEDKSFDLVMANDVIEHIPDGDYEKALRELERVAVKYILITVPNFEDIKSKETKCSDCGYVYHINWHQRTYDESTMKNLISKKDWAVDEIRYSGGTTLPPQDPTVGLKQKLDYFYYWEGAVCPRCSSKKQVNKEENITLRVLNAARHTKWFSDNPTEIRMNRSELITLYARKETNGRKSKVENININVEKSLREVDFSNKLQYISDFIPGSHWARFTVFDNSAITEKGIINISGETSYTEVITKLPVAPQIGDIITLRVSGQPNRSGRVVLYAVDGISGVNEFLHEATISDSNAEIDFPLEFIWTADRFGLSISIYLYGDITLHSLEHRTVNDNKVQFVLLNEGKNVLTRVGESYIRSWSLSTPVSGAWPMPSWLFDEKISIERREDIKLEQINKEVQVSIEFISRKNYRLNSLIEEKEKHYLQIEESVAKQMEELNSILNQKEEQIEELNFILTQKEEQIGELNSILNQKEEQREAAEKAYKDASYYAAFWHKSVARKVQRVLVFSHMFPHPDNKIFGPFIYEQIKALRDCEGIDARVISCRPFWMNGINVPKLWKANKFYQQELKNAEWTEYDGVPVLYLPYRVGRPFFMFPFHAWSYRSAIMSCIEHIWRDFKFDIIHAHTGYLDGTAGLAVARHYKVPFVITEHTGPFSNLTRRLLVKQLTLKSIREADRVWCVSDSLADEVKSYYTDKNVLNRIKVLYNGVSMDKFYPSDVTTPKDRLTLLYVGYLEEVKDPINLIRAFAKVKKALPSVKLKIVGDGALFNHVQNEIKQLSLEDSCELTGMKSREEVADIIREECDIFVLPSKAETFGVVLIEALACGKPVIATRCGGPESIVKEDYLGELCESRNSDKLAEAIIKVANNINQYDVQIIRDYAVNNFDYKNITQKLIEQYQEF